MDINNINNEIIELIHQIINKIINSLRENITDNDSNLQEKIMILKRKLLEFLHDILVKFILKEKFSYLVINGYISIFSKILSEGKLIDKYSIEYLDEFLELSIIFQKDFSFLKNINTNEINSIKKSYEQFLIKFLITTNSDFQTKLKNISDIKDKKKGSIFSKKKKEEKIFKDNEYLNHYIEFILKNQNFPYIFSALLNILYEANLIPEIKSIYIEQIKNILIRDFKIKNKNYLSQSCLRTLLVYSITNQKDEDNLHNFIKQLKYNKELFYSIITSMKQIKYINNNEKIINDININNSYSNMDISIIEENKSESLPLLFINLNNLNNKQNRTLINLFQYCISLLNPSDKTPKDKEINDELKKDSEDIYNILKRNIDEVFKCPGKNIYYDLFSSGSKITSELFYFKYKFSNQEGKNNLLKDLKLYHNQLLKNHNFPFIFQFILLIDSESHLNEAMDYIVDILLYLIEIFECYFKKSNIKICVEDIYYIINLINYIILINKLALKNEKEVNIIQNTNFKEIFYRALELLKLTGLLYSNYCFEINENFGKLICEICYDIFLSLLNYNFSDNDKEKFEEIFYFNNRNENVKYNLFGLIDLNREEVLTKDKKLKEKLFGSMEFYSNLEYIHEKLFIFNDTKKNDILVFGKTIKKIEGVNFSIYFLAKTLIYWKEITSANLKKYLNDIILPNLFDSLYKLYTENKILYGHKTPKNFLLYKLTKDFFESKINKLKGNFELLKQFFINDISNKLKGEDKIYHYYSSRLIDTKKAEQNIKEKEEILSTNIKDPLIIIPNDKITIPKINKNYLRFDCLINENVLLNPKNYYMKIIFSTIFKDIFFHDKIFKKIKSIYLSKFRSYKDLGIRTKQLEYPTKEKNFSNSLEPKSFLRRDYRFYNNKFFAISYEYIKKDFLCDKNDNKLFFYNHEFIRDIQNEKIFECELITNQYLYFGNFIVHNKYIYFKTVKNPKDDKDSKEKENLFSKYIFSGNLDENRANKEKEILMYIKDIKEIIKRRTLLMNQSLEIFNKNGKSFFFNFFKTKLCEQVCDFLKYECKCIIEDGRKENIDNIISLYKSDKLSNYEYLLYLNKLSTRTFNDLTQYPIFPWLVKDIERLIKEDDNKNYSPKKEEKVEKKIEKCGYFRDMNFPITMQNPEDRDLAIREFQKYLNDEKFPYHLYSHYSTYVDVIFILLRKNPYNQNYIRFMDYDLGHPERLFLSFKEMEYMQQINRELIPDLFCYIDYFCNLNCAFFGLRYGSESFDDFLLYENYDENKNKYYNNISHYVKYLYVHRKLLNDKKTSEGISQWVDIIFGKKQFPKDEEERRNSCNIYHKYSYEQCTNLEKKLMKYIIKYNEDKNEELEKELLKKIKDRIMKINIHGICPRQILTKTIHYERKSAIKTPKEFKKVLKNEFYFYFTNNYGKYYTIFENSNNSNKIVKIWDNIYSKDHPKKYECGNFENNISKFYNNNECFNFLYKTNYIISLITLINHINKSETFVITGRYLGNYFKIQNSERDLNVLCEDFVTTIVSRYSNENDDIFYTGLKNGKLIQWKILLTANIKNDKKDKLSSFIVEEINHIYDHSSSITAIEINKKKQIIATTGEDKYINIRKLYDFEILTSIDMTYCYANPIISQYQNIFPSLIKISDLNCIYVLFYDYDTKQTFIRGYTLNGLFFAQTNNDDKERKYYNNFVINKNGNLLVGLYNGNKIIKLNSFDLKIRSEKEILNKNNENYKWIDIDCTKNNFIVLYKDYCQIIPINE